MPAHNLIQHTTIIHDAEMLFPELLSAISYPEHVSPTKEEVDQLIAQLERAQLNGEDCLTTMQHLVGIKVWHTDTEISQYAYIRLGTFVEQALEQSKQIGSIASSEQLIEDMLNEANNYEHINRWRMAQLATALYTSCSSPHELNSFLNHPHPAIRSFLLMIHFDLEEQTDESELNRLWKLQQPLIERDIDSKEPSVSLFAMEELQLFVSVDHNPALDLYRCFK